MYPSRFRIFLKLKSLRSNTKPTIVFLHHRHQHEVHKDDVEQHLNPHVNAEVPHGGDRHLNDFFKPPRGCNGINETGHDSQ